MQPDKLKLPDDGALLGFIFTSFIAGEMTGLLEGKALCYAPNLKAADFLARQVQDEIRHAQMYAALCRYVSPEKKLLRPPWLLQAIISPITGRLWAEHCFLDKAVGERWVLYLMRQLIEDVQDTRIQRTLQKIAKDEEVHIAFGEAQTRSYVANSAFWRYYLWGLFLRVDLALLLAYRMLHPLLYKKYSKAAATMLTRFFTQSRVAIANECAALLQVKPRRSLLQMLVCQLVFCFRWLLVGWGRSPKVKI